MAADWASTLDNYQRSENTLKNVSSHFNLLIWACINCFLGFLKCFFILIYSNIYLPQFYQSFQSKEACYFFFNMHLCSQDSQLNLPSLSLCFLKKQTKKGQTKFGKRKINHRMLLGRERKGYAAWPHLFCISPETRTKHLQECSQRQWLITMTGICPTDTVTKCSVNFPLV